MCYDPRRYRKGGKNMGYLEIELLARTIDGDRFREAERCRRIHKALATRHRRSTNPAQILVHWLQSLAKWEQRLAGEQQSRALAELT
jgi:hypothetical protein